MDRLLLRSVPDSFGNVFMKRYQLVILDAL